jgi:hypothetical protein
MNSEPNPSAQMPAGSDRHTLVFRPEGGGGIESRGGMKNGNVNSASAQL